MIIMVNGLKCDTKNDWGYNTDEEFVAYIFSEKLRLEALVKRQNAEITRLQKIEKYTGKNSKRMK